MNVFDICADSFPECLIEVNINVVSCYDRRNKHGRCCWWDGGSRCWQQWSQQYQQMWWVF